LDPKGQKLLTTLVSDAPERKIDSLVERLNDAESSDNQRRYIVDCLKSIGTHEAFAAIREFGEKEAGTAVGKFAESVAVESVATTSGIIRLRGAVKGVSEVEGKVRALKELAGSFRNPVEFNAEYIRIPGGSFEYSLSKQDKRVPDIYFAKYPVTNKRYRRFISYLAAREEELGEALPVKVFGERMLEFAADVTGYTEYLGTDPRGWAEKLRSGYDEEKRFKGDDQPVAGVSWFDAQAYCLWLSALQAASQGVGLEEFGCVYRLPKDVEWEWAAGGGKREYPWALEKGEPSDKLANYGHVVGATTPAGRYPEGGTPEGLMDMAGNVWEWMENTYGHEAVPDARSLRGGSWDYGARHLSCSFRFVNNPVLRCGSVGFRVVFSQS
jgi:formylglycine-generating enzyme required for sulfatase activity